VGGRAAHDPGANPREHQRILGDLIEFLRPRLRETRRGTLAVGINVFREWGAALDYRIPDLTFVAAGREHVLRDDGVRGGGPDAVIEIRSPEDETYEKVPFYAALAVKEVIVCQRGSKVPEIFRLGRSLALQADRDGWLDSTALGVRFRCVVDAPPRLRVEDASDPAISVEI